MDEDFTWSPDLTIKFIHMRLQHDWLFQKRKQSWSTLHSILMQKDFPKCITVKSMRKKWSNLSEDYKRTLRKKSRKWAYFDVFHSYFAQSNCMEAYPSWTDEWLKKFITIRTENEAYFNGNDFEGWNHIERRLREEGLPVECSVQHIDKMWATLIKTYRLRQDSGGNLKYPWSLYKPMKKYFDTHNVSLKHTYVKVKKEKHEDNDSDSDNECLSKLKLNLNKTNEEGQQIEIEYEEDNFKWTPEWTRSLIQFRFENDDLFKHKKHPWKEFHKMMMENGFPESISVTNVRKKWAAIFEEYRKAVTLNNTKWIYYELIHKYVGGDNSMDTFKLWNDDWIKRLIKLKVKHTLAYENKITINDEKIWSSIESDLRNAKIPLKCSLRNIQSIWASLIKTFKLKYKLATKNAKIITWPFYSEMLLYFEKCEPNCLLKLPIKDSTKNDNMEADNDMGNGLFDVKDDNDDEIENSKQVITIEGCEIKKELLNVTCRTCMGMSDVMLPLFKSEDLNLCDKLMAITSIQISQNDDYPQSICQVCANELNSAYSFKKKCEETDNLMKSTWCKDENFKVIKEECEDIDSNKEDDFDDNRDDLIDNENYFTNTTSGNENEIINSRILSKPYDIVIKKCKRPHYKRKSKRKIIKRTRIKSKNLVYIPVVNESGETFMKKKYVYFKVCDICGKSTQRMSEHMRMHSDEKTLKCPQCPKMFKSTPGLQSHIKTHSDTPLKICQLCGREFYRDKSYKRHLIYHANERKYKCDSCDKSFNTKEILVVHQRLHTGERPFSCKICGKSFVTSGCVSRHQKVHKVISKLPEQ